MSPKRHAVLPRDDAMGQRGALPEVFMSLSVNLVNSRDLARPKDGRAHSANAIGIGFAIQAGH